MNLLKTICIVSLLALTYTAKSQTVGKAIALSPEIGDVIDSTEKADNHLFPYFLTETFQRAQIFKQADSSYVIKIVLKDDEKDSKVISKEEFNSIRDRVNYKPVVYKQSIYLLGGVGYATNISKENIDYSAAAQSSKYNGFGAGMQYSFGVGFKRSEHLSYEFKADFLNGTDIALYNGTINVFAARFTPLLKVGFIYNSIEPYIKIGPTFGLASNFSYKFIETETDNNGNSAVINEEYKLTGGFSIGVHTAVGFTTKINSRFNFFGEMTVNTISHAPTKQTITKYTENGVDRIADLTHTEFTLKEDPNSSDSSERFTRYYNLSNIGFNVGFIIYLN